MSFNSYDLLRLVRDFGEPLTLKKTTNNGSYDVASGTMTGTTSTNYTFTGYLYNVNIGIDPNLDDITNKRVKCVVPALGLAVDVDSDDVITDGLGDLKVVSVQTIYSDGIPVCYLCTLRV